MLVLNNNNHYMFIIYVLENKPKGKKLSIISTSFVLLYRDMCV